MTQTAKVKRILGPSIAEVAVKRVSACAHDCSKCASGGCQMLEHPDLTVRAYNPLHAQVGDVVLVESSSKQILSMAAVVYLLPFVLLIIGYSIAAVLGQREGICILTGGICFVLSFFVSFALNKHTEKNTVHFSVIQILS